MRNAPHCLTGSWLVAFVVLLWEKQLLSFFLCLTGHVGRREGCDGVEASKRVCLLHFFVKLFCLLFMRSLGFFFLYHR